MTAVDDPPDALEVMGIQGDPDRPLGTPDGPCAVCGAQESRKQSLVVTGVYSRYPLCADSEACDDRLSRLLPVRAEAAETEDGSEEIPVTAEDEAAGNDPDTGDDAREAAAGSTAVLPA